MWFFKHINQHANLAKWRVIRRHQLINIKSTVTHKQGYLPKPVQTLAPKRFPHQGSFGKWMQQLIWLLWPTPPLFLGISFDKSPKPFIILHTKKKCKTECKQSVLKLPVSHLWQYHEIELYVRPTEKHCFWLWECEYSAYTQCTMWPTCRYNSPQNKMASISSRVSQLELSVYWHLDHRFLVPDSYI